MKKIILILLPITLVIAVCAPLLLTGSPKSKLKKYLGLSIDLTPVEEHFFEEKFCRSHGLYPLVLPQESLRCGRLEYNLDEGPQIAYIAMPETQTNNSRLPAIIVLHGHLSRASDLISVTTSTMVWPIATLLAHQGFAVVVPQDRWDSDDPIRETHNALRLLPMGKTLMGERVADVLRLIRHLRERREIDPGRIGLLGWSMGGDVALYSAVLDSRVKAIYLSSSLGSFQELINARSLHTSENYIPSIMKTFGDKAEIAALLYPRPLLIEHGFNDRVNPFFRANEGSLFLRRVYGNKAASRLYFLKHGLAHRFYGARAVTWFKQWL